MKTSAKTLLAVCLFGACAPAVAMRNGTPEPGPQYYAVGQILPSATHGRGTGVLISRNCFLTGARNLTDSTPGATYVFALDNEHSATVTGIRIHPEFINQWGENPAFDVAVVMLDTNQTRGWDCFVRAVVRTNPVTVGVLGVGVGFGETSDGAGAGARESGRLQVTSYSAGNGSYNETIPNAFLQVVPGDSSNQMMCPGDGGGPLYVNGQIAGVASFALEWPCSAVTSAYCVAMERFGDWITNMVAGLDPSGTCVCNPTDFGSVVTVPAGQTTNITQLSGQQLCPPNGLWTRWSIAAGQQATNGTASITSLGAHLYRLDYTAHAGYVGPDHFIYAKEDYDCASNSVVQYVRVTVQVVPPNFTITNLANSGAGTLRSALAASAPGSRIDFAAGLSGTITLTNGELVVGQSLTINGPGARLLTISGNNSSRVFNIASGVTAAISGLTIANGRSAATNAGAPAWGGGVLNRGSLTLSNCLLSGNVVVGGSGADSGWGGPGGTGGAGLGGGIFNGSNLFLYGCTFRTNTAWGGPGGNGIDTTYTGGIAGHGGAGANGAGGGLCSTGAVQMLNCTFWGNTARGGAGGNGGSDGDQCGPPGNGGQGGSGSGGAMESSGTGTLVNCTLSSNSVARGIGGNGGASFDDMGNPCGVGSNGAGGLTYGGGVRATSSLGGIINTIIAANSGASSRDVSGYFTSLGHNLIGATNGSTGWWGSDVRGSVATPANALLGSLQDNGGPTPTQAPATNSPAVDGGDESVLSTLTFDQRGLPRFYGTHVDIGADEVQPIRPTLTVARSGSSVIVSWASPSTGYQLQVNTNNVSSVNWSNVLTTPTDDGTTKTLIINPPTGNRFYRLWKP